MLESVLPFYLVGSMARTQDLKTGQHRLHLLSQKNHQKEDMKEQERIHSKGRKLGGLVPILVNRQRGQDYVWLSPHFVKVLCSGERVSRIKSGSIVLM